MSDLSSRISTKFNESRFDKIKVELKNHNSAIEEQSEENTNTPSPEVTDKQKLLPEDMRSELSGISND